ncbi:microtubule-actin cross-linking factor 1 isoform X5 [Monodelphis domestica]|uniref:microtubule-actin cross-linking factor 1 isoform X5 n=1 Tax=Monodelphis domestica TaxID=13616 RepID=UPI0024E1CC61|nr:microtubule-actin cross-linking factor 1 isoform X5 [Monodelphis domestica]
MGNSLGCVKEPKDSVTVTGKAPISPKKRARFKRKWRGKKTPTPEASPKEEPSEGTEAIEENEPLKKLRVSVSPSQEEEVEAVESPLQDLALPTDPAPSLGTGDQGLIVQVKEKFQEEIQTAQLLITDGPLGAERVRDSLEEGTTVIAHLFDNPAERNCEKSVSRLVAFPRTASCSSRAVLLPLQKETAVDGENIQHGSRMSILPRTDQPIVAETGGMVLEDQTLGGQAQSILITTWTDSWSAEPGTASELSTPSPLEQLERHRFEKPPRVSSSSPRAFAPMGQETHHGSNLPTSQSDLSVSALTTSGMQPSSSGYGSDGPYWKGLHLKDAEPSKSSKSLFEEDGALSLEAGHILSWGPKEISDIYISGESGDMSAKEKLLLWTQKVTAGYTGIKCTNFSSCWSDGKMFNALIHRYRPDLVDMERVQIQSNRENLEQAFEVAERLGVTRLLDAEDVDVPSPDEKSVITYVSSIYDAFPKVPEGGEGISATEVDSRWQEYQNRVDSLIPWIKQHTMLMSEKSFPQNPVELKALYNQYIHFKETEILAKEREKGRIEELYKLLEVWIEFGRIKLPQGYHPNDVEEEWGKLIIEMLEREKLLRPAVERLELLLQIANKIQNGALRCEEKLTLAKNTLQADTAQVESGQPLQHEPDAIMYLQECEGLIRQLQVDLQILRDENYYQVEELAFRIMRLQDELVSWKLECTNLFFNTLEFVQPSTLTTTHLKTNPLTKGTHPPSTSWFRKPMTRAELVSISSSEDEGSLRFVYELLSWVEEMQMKLERAEWGNDLPSVELQLETQQHTHTSVEELGSSVKEARMYEGKMSQNFRASYTETLGKLETQYCKLMETSSFRLRNLQSLHKFVSKATTELIWLNEKEEEELAFDWSDNNPNITAKKNYFSELTMELDDKQDVFRSLQDTAELLSLENHPAKQTVEAYSAAIQSQWQWMKQLCLCVEHHVKENSTYFQFFSDAKDLETFLKNLQDSIKRKYSCDCNTSLSRLEDLLQDSMDEKEQLIHSKSSVASLVGRSKTIIQLKPRNPDHVLASTISIKAICDYRQIEITIYKNDECVLEDNSQRTKWKVISPTGNEAMVPSVCFLIPPPNTDAIEVANRVEQAYQKVMTLWHQLHMNTKSLISWHYLRKDIDLVQSWNLEKLRSLASAESHQVMENLQTHYEDFLQDSRDSSLFSVSDRLHLEEEVDSCKAHYQQLAESLENEDKDETVARTYISELTNIRLRLEDCEQRLIRRIQSPTGSRTDEDARQDNALRIAEQEHTQEDLQQLRTDFDNISMRCKTFLQQSPSGSSIPTLQSEFSLLVEKMTQVYGLSSVYLDKLKTIDVIVRDIQGAELLVKGYEIKLSQEEAVPADLSALQSHRAALEQWLKDVKDKNSVFLVLDEEIAKAKMVAEQLCRLMPERSLDLERCQERGSQLQERWHRVAAQIESRQSELESIQEVLRDYRSCHGALIQWIEETTAQQEVMKPGQAEDSRLLSEQLSQQTALVAEIERNQAKLDQCQKFSQQYSASVKDYELQLMTYRAFVESQQKSPGKRRRMLSSSDAITQEFMDLRTRYTALVTLTTQHVKYISDALRRLEEEEKVVEEEKQEHVEKVKDLLVWVSALARSPQGKAISSQGKELTDIEKAILEQQVLTEELATKKEQISEAIKTSQIFLAKHGHKLSDQEKEQISEQLKALKTTYQEMCDGSAQQIQQLQGQLAQKTEQKGSRTVAGVIDLGTVEIFPIFKAMQKGLIDQDTGLVLLEAQVIMSGLDVPETNEKVSLEEGLSRSLIDQQTCQLLQELEDAYSSLNLLSEGTSHLSVVEAMEKGKISERVGMKILEVLLATGSFPVSSTEKQISLKEASYQELTTAHLHSKIETHLRSCKNLIDPNTAEKISLLDLMHRCIVHQDSGLRLLPVKQLAGGMVSLKSGRKVSIFRAVQEGLIDRQVTVRLLEAQLFAGGIVDPRTGHRLTVDEAVRYNLIDQDMACAILIRQLQTGGIIDTVTGYRLTIDEALRKDLITSKMALVILQSLWSFMGLLWPESGEILSIADALEQGIISTELAYEILSNRKYIKALFQPATTEIWSWKKAVEKGILDKDVAKNLKSTCIPDVMPHMQLAVSSESPLGFSALVTAPLYSQDQSGHVPGSYHEKLLFHLMTHSYIDVHSGHRLLLLDEGLLELLTLGQRETSHVHPLETCEVSQRSLKALREIKDSASLRHPEVDTQDGLNIRHQELQIVLKEGSPKEQPTNSQTGRKKMTLEVNFSTTFESEKKSFPEEREVRIPNLSGLKSILNTEPEQQRQTSKIKKEEPKKLYSNEESMGVASRTSFVGLTKEAQGIQFSIDNEPLSAGLKRKDRSTLTETVSTLQEQGVIFRIEKEAYISGRIGGDLVKLQSEQSESQEEKTLYPDTETKPLNIKALYFLEKERTMSELIKEEEREVQNQSLEKEKITNESLKMVKKSTEAMSVDGVMEMSLDHLLEPSEDATLKMLSAQLENGGIYHNETGQKLLLNEAVSWGIVPSHTAVKLMEKLKMFRGFFDSQTCESLTTEEVIDEGLMNENLLQKVFTSDKTISGVLDPYTNTVHSVRDAVRVGLLGKQTAMRILEGQVVTGGIVDLKRDKKVSVTLASNLGLVDSADQKELICLEKATKGKDSEKITKQKLIGLQIETNGIIDPETKTPLTVVQSINKGLLEREEAIQLLTKQVVDGGIIHHDSGMRLSVDNATEHGLIDGDLSKELKQVENMCLHQFIHPTTKVLISLPEAIAIGLVTLDFTNQAQEIQALKGSFVDPISGQRLSLSEAIRTKLSSNEATLSSGMMHGIVDPENCKIIPYSEFIKKCKIDVESGQRYLEIIPFSDIRDEVTGKQLTLSEAAQFGKVDLVPVLRLLEAQADSGGIFDITTGKRLSLKAALEQKLVDEKMVQLIATHQVLNGGIIDVSSGQRVTLIEAAERGLIHPELVASIQKDIHKTNDSSQIEIQRGTESCELKNEFPRREILAVYKQASEISCYENQEETEKLFLIEKRAIDEKTKIRILESSQEAESLGRTKRPIPVPEAKLSQERTPKDEQDSPKNLQAKEQTVQEREEESSVNQKFPLTYKAKDIAPQAMSIGTIEQNTQDVNIFLTFNPVKSLQNPSVSFRDKENVSDSRSDSPKERSHQEIICELLIPDNTKVHWGSSITLKEKPLQEVTGEYPISLVPFTSEKPLQDIPRAVIREPQKDTVHAKFKSQSSPENNGEKTVPLASTQAGNLDEKTDQEKVILSSSSEQSLFVTSAKGKENEDTSQEPFKAAKTVYSRRLCLEHDEQLVSYLSLLRNIEMRTKQICPAELSLAELQDQLRQAKVLDRELRDLSTLVNHELECVHQIVTTQPQEVPAQLLKALEKDAKNLQKSFSSVSDTWASRLLSLQNSVDAEKTKILNQYEVLQGRLQELGTWINETRHSLYNMEHVSKSDATDLNNLLKEYEALKQPFSERRSQLDILALDIQYFISEHAQNLSPQQSRKLLRLLNELQKAFHELSVHAIAQKDALQGCLQQAMQAAQVQTLQEQKNTCHQKLEDLCAWVSQAEQTLTGHHVRGGSPEDLSTLQQKQDSVKDLQKDVQNRAISFANIIKDTEGFLEENQTKLNPHELSSLREKLLQAKEQSEALQERTRMAKKELEEAVTLALQQESEKTKAAKELEENKSKIDALLDWVASLESTSGLPKSSFPKLEDSPGGSLGNGITDTLDGYSEMSHAPEKLDQLYEGAKTRHQELLSQQQDFILATQAAQAFLDKYCHSLAPEEQQKLQQKLGDLKEQYSASLAQAETELKQMQALRDELQKFLRDHREFEDWLQQAEQELENVHKGGGDPAALQSLLLRQRSFSEDVISHKGDLRFVTMSGQKVLDTENSSRGGTEPSATRHLVTSKLDDATQRYTALHSKCNKLGSHLNMLLEHSQQFQSSADGLQAWIEECESKVNQLLSDPVASDPTVLQQQLTNTKQLQGGLAEHQVPVEKLQKAAEALLEMEGEPAPDPQHIQETTDSILGHFQSLSGRLEERADLLQKAIAQSQSVQEGLENLLQSIIEVEKSLEGEQVASLTSTAIQEALAINMKLKQDIVRQKSSLEATREMVTQFMETADGATATGLQGKLAEVSEQFSQLCQRQQEKESSLKKLLPQVEMFEHISEKLQQFLDSRARMLATGNQPDRDIAQFSQQIQELNLEMGEQQENLDALEHLVIDLSSCGFALDTSQHEERVQKLKKDFMGLQKSVQEREKETSSCQEQLDEFRKLVQALQKWLKESEGNMPVMESSMSTRDLQKQIEQLEALLDDWTSKGLQVEEINRKGLALENLIVEITAPETQSKTGSVLPSLGGSVGSVNGYHTCKDLTEIQCHMSDVSQQYEKLGGVLQERRDSLLAMLSSMQEVQEEASSLLQWLESKENALKAFDASSSPTKTETMRAQAECNKAFLAELEQNSPKIHKVKEALAGLLKKYPNSQEAKHWKEMEEELSSRWERANEVTAARQQKLEESANQLASFQAAETQLRPWLTEKELMMSVLGPLSIDPNMLNAQKQQVQFMLKEFEARKPQHEQLNQAAQGILTGPGDGSPSASQVQEELQNINNKWIELTDRLNSRSSQIDQTLVKSTQYQELLQNLSERVKAVGQQLNGQSAISTQPAAVKQQLEETSEIRSDLEQLDHEITDAQALCDELSTLIGEQYLKDELRKRLETVALPLKGLEDLAADRMNKLQTALASTQQFQQMFDELRTWLDDKQNQQAKAQPISAKLDRLHCQLQEQEEFQKSLNQRSGSYEVIIIEGESLLLSVHPGEEKKTLQSQLIELKSHWEELSKKAADRQSRLKDCLQKAQKYQWHVEDLIPWIEDCKAKMSDLQVTLDPVQLEAHLLRSKAMLTDVEKRRSLLEMLNSTADILINSSQTDEDDIRDEKAGINQNMDAITEELQAKTESLEEMTQRLKEFQDSYKNIEKKLDGTKHQLEIFDALGPQACSNKNLEKLRAQQEVLQALEPQVDYLKNFTQGLVEDAPQGSDASQLQHQAEVTEQDFMEVKERVNSSCVAMENKLEGIGQFHCRVREMFSQLADLDDELDSMRAIGRDIDSLQSQIEDVRLFLSKIQSLKLDIKASEGECRQMLEEEGSLDLLGLKRELEALSKQCGKLTERGKARQEQLELTLARVGDFYSKMKELNDMTTAAEEGEALQWVVGTEVDAINQQLADFKMFQKEQVDPLQMKLQQVNGLGQGLIQSAGKHCDVQGLEHDMEEINARWNTLNKKVAQRIAQLQEALLHCGKFQDALEPLLSWLADTEDLIANQKPPSAEYKVVKAQIQEQKLLQRLLDDRKATVDMLQAEGERIAQSAELADREKIISQLESLGRRWTELLSKAASRQKQLEDILVLAKQFHETAEPVSDFLSVTEKKLANSEPVGTQTAKIQQQIARHKALEEEIESRAADVQQAVRVGQSLSSLTYPAEQGVLAERLEALQARYSEVQERCCRKAALLEQAIANARLFGEDEVEVLNWLAEAEDKLSSVFVKDYRQDVLQKQHADHLALNEEIVNRKKTVDQAVKNGQALLKQTTGEEVLLIQEKLDGIKTRYADLTVSSSKALRTLEQARQLATKFQSTHDELTGWMSKVEEELMASGGQSPTGEQIPQFQQRQKELKKEVMEHRLVLDTVNEVSRALLELVPWRAREGLDKLVSDANDQYKLVSDTIGQRVDEIDAAIQRSQQYEQAADAELAWVAETKRKLMALGPIRLEQDQTTAQLQVQKAFSIDIIRHKDSMDELFSQRSEIFGSCGEEQKALLQEKTESLVQQYEAISQLNSERYARLERAQVLVNQFWETYEELSPWIEETQTLISQLPPPAIDHEQLKQQQEEMRQLRESIAEHKPHIDKLLKIGPQLKELNPNEGEMVQEKYQKAETTYARIKEEVRRRALALDEAVSQSAQFHDKMEPMLETLENLSSRLRIPPLIPAEVDKIRECLSDNKSTAMELEKLQPSFEALKRRGEELIGRSQGADKDLAAKEIQDKLDQMVFFWEDIKAQAEEREVKFLDVLELAEKFWYDMAALLATIKDTQDIVHDLESPGIDPSIIKQQVEAAETIKEETDGLHEELEFIRILGADLIFACGETEKPEVKKSIDEMNNAWENLNKTWRERLEKLEEAMQAAVQYQDTLQTMFDWLDNTVIKLCNMPPVGTDLNTVKDQLNEMKEFKMEVYQQQIEMEKLNHQGELMLKKATDETDRDIIREPLTELKHLWENLGEKIAHRQHKLEGALLALGQFQHALEELMSWLTHTEELLDAQRPINGDPKVIEVELAKHHVLKNDVLAHQATVDTVNKAGNELLESSAGDDDASSLRNRLETMNQCWESVLQKTEEREQQLQSTLQQAQGFHSEIEDFLLRLTRMENQLSSSKPTGGLPETAREQLDAHMELYDQLKGQEETYNQLLDKGRLMLLSRDDSGSGSKTEQSVTLLEQKWHVVSSKMEERKSKLEEVLNLATEFQNSLQEFINWLTLAEQSLNIAPPPSLILNTILLQIDEHKVFANEVNAHRDHIIELDQTGNQLKFLSQKQDVVLIKNLLVSVQSRWEKVVQRSVERGRSLDDARKRAKQFHEAWKKLIDWLEDAENHLDSELEISNDPDKIKLQLSRHKEFQKTLGGKQPVYDTTIRTGRALKEKTSLPDDVQKLDNCLGEVRDKWDTVCGKSVERQHKLEEALLFSGQFMDALQALVDWLYKVEPQLAEDQPVHGDLDLVMNLMDAHKVFQKELGKRTGTVQVLKRLGRELIENSRDDTTWVRVQLQELSTRWDTVCKLSVSKQTRLEHALKQAEEFRNAVHMLLEWLSEAEQTLRFRGALPDDTEALQSLIDVHKEFMKKVEEKRVDVNASVAMGEDILAMCHPDCVTTIKHWITIIRARFEEVLTWAKQHQQRLEAALSELIANAELLEELLAWIQWAETTLIQRDQEPTPQNIDRVKSLISEHQAFMEEMTRKQPDVDRVTKTYKRKAIEPTHAPFIEKSRSNRKSLGQTAPPPMPLLSQSEAKNPRIHQLSARWQQVWLLALERQRKLNDMLDRLEELKEFANFDFDVWRKKYMRWMNHKKSRVMDFFRRIDKDQDGKITRQEFIDGILASKFPTTKLEMTAVADIFDRDGDGYIDYYEFVAALHPNKDAYRPTTDADKIEDEVTRQVAQCKCAKRFQVEQIGENKYRFFLGNQFGDSQQLRLVRILRSTVMVRVGGGWMALDEFLVKNDPCRARGRTNIELREKFILPEGVSQGMTPFRSRGRRSKPSSRAASPTRSSSSASQSNHSCASMPSSPATPASGAKTPHQPSRCYDKPWLVNSKAGTPLRDSGPPDLQLPGSEVMPSTGSKLKRPAFHSSRTSLTGDASNSSSPVSSSAKTNRADAKKTTSRPTSRAGSRTGSRASSRRGSDASDFDLLETQSACSDTSESSTAGGQGSSRRGLTKPSKIPTMSKKTATASPRTPGPKR